MMTSTTNQNDQSEPNVDDKDSLIRGASPLLVLSCIALLIIPHLITIDASSPYFEIWKPFADSALLYVAPIGGLALIPFIGWPTMKEFVAATATAIVEIGGFLAASFFLAFPHNLVVLFLIITPAGFWLFKFIMNRGKAND